MTQRLLMVYTLQRLIGMLGYSKGWMTTPICLSREIISCLCASVNGGLKPYTFPRCSSHASSEGSTIFGIARAAFRSSGVDSVCLARGGGVGKV